MKREEILAVLTDHAKLWEGRGDIGYAGDLIAIRGVIASALDDAERYRWLRDQSQDDISIRVESSMRSGRRSYYKVAGPGVDGLIDIARTAAAGGEGVL